MELFFLLIFQSIILSKVYGEHIDNVGHQYGPDSYEMQLALRQVDEVLLEFLNDLERHPRLNRKVIAEITVIVIKFSAIKLQPIVVPF